MKKALVTLGLPGCGKSTFVSEFVRQHPSYMLINRSELNRVLNHNNPNHWSGRSLSALAHGKKLYKQLLNQYIGEGKNIAICEILLGDAHRQALLKRLVGEGYEVTLVVFKAGIKTCRIGGTDVDWKVIQKFSSLHSKCVYDGNIQREAAEIGFKILWLPRTITLTLKGN